MRALNTLGAEYPQKAKDVLAQHMEIDSMILNQGGLLEIIPRYDVLIMANNFYLKIDKEVMERGKNLKYIATATTGLDHIDIDYAQKKGIKVISLRGETEFLNTITGTAEMAFGLIIDLMRFSHPAFESVKNYEWNNKKYRGYNLYKKTIGIVGLGRLGSLMARYANAFYMNVLAYDPFVEDEKFLKLNVKKTDFDPLLKTSDVISIHVHLSQETENLFGEKEFHKMKPSAYLINTSRGKIVNEKELLEAMQNKKIAGYAADVLADELNFDKKDFSQHPLVEYAKKNNNCIIVPHIAGETHESREMTDVFIAEKIIKIIGNT